MCFTTYNRLPAQCPCYLTVTMIDKTRVAPNVSYEYHVRQIWEQIWENNQKKARAENIDFSFPENL